MDEWRHLRGALARSAREKDQRVEAVVVAECGQHDDREGEPAAGARLAVLEDRERPAVRVGRPLVACTQMQPIEP